MKLHDLRPNPGAHTAKTRVGRGIAAGKGKTAGRGTKGQKARAGGTIPPWFEGGQTPLHIRIPKLRGFRNRGKVVYEVVNLGAINRLVELGELAPGELPGATASRSAQRAPVTVNQEILRAAGLVSTLARPLKILGQGDVTAPLFVVADAFSKSAIEKIQAAGGTAQVLETPATPLAALMGTEPSAEGTTATVPPVGAALPEAEAEAEGEAQPAAAEPDAEAAQPGSATADADATPRAPRRSRSKGASTEADGGAA
jgi:large subunit ribosomal protein L15